MPTPDDAIVSEHESIAGRATCPPEESRIITTHELNEQVDITTASNVASAPDAPMQQPTPPPQESPVHAQMSGEAHSKPASTDIEAPSRDIPTPMTATDDGGEEQRTSQASPLSANAPVPVSLLANQLSSPFPAYRVCTTKSIPRTICRHSSYADVQYSFSPTRPLPSSAPVAASRAAKHQTGSSTKWR